MSRTKKEVADVQGTEDVITETPKKAAKEAKVAGPTFEKWSVAIKSMGNKQYQLTAVEVLRENVKIAQSTVDMLNEQSHNNGVRYYETGTIINGNKETITIN